MIDTSNMSHKEWLQVRKESIGGSDVATALGLSKYKSPYMLWLDKTGRFDFSGSSPVTDFGNLWEPFAREHFQTVTGLDVTVDNTMYYHSDYKMLSANIDGRIQSPNGDGVLEIKPQPLIGCQSCQILTMFQ